MIAIKHNVTEAHREVEHRESWHAEINGYDVIISNDRGGMSRSRITVSAVGRDGVHDFRDLSIMEFSPRYVSALESFADESRDLIRGIAAMLRQMGKEDLRSEWEINDEKRTKELRASIDKLANPPFPNQARRKRAKAKQ